MTDSTIIALAAVIGAILTPVTALILNYRGFNSLERRLELIEADLKMFYREITQIKARIGLDQ